jgi:tRNA A-37 threonylcarbamoyl transferase component Bud32
MSALATLVESRDAADTELRGLLFAEDGETERTDLTPEQESRSAELLKELKDIDVRIDEVAGKLERDKRLAEARSLIAPKSAGVSVADEPMVYGQKAQQSFYLDQIRSAMFRMGIAPTDAGAGQRLAEYQHQIEREIADDSKIGQRAAAHVRESFRESGTNAPRLFEEVRSRGRASLEDKAETRGIATGGGTTASAAGGGGAAVVSPVIFLDEYAPYKQYGREFANACAKQELPSYGMEIYVPAVTGPASDAQGTEGSSVNETDPTLAFRSATVITINGQVTVTQQLLDRAGPNFAFDKLIFNQLNRSYAQNFDQYVITQALANATSQSWTGNAGVFVLSVASGSGGFVGQVQKAAGAMEELEGTVTTPTCLFLKPSRWRFIESWSDAQGRPIVVPNEAGNFNTWGYGAESGDHAIEGFTGYNLGGIPVYKDANIPLVGTTTQDQAVVADLSQVFVFEGPQNPRVLPQTLAGTLQVILQTFSYAAALPLYPAAVTSINGTGFSPITYTD